MALFFLLISFFLTLWGAWVFFDAFLFEDHPTKQMVGILSGIGLAVVPYLVGKSLSEMVAIRQRHLMLEQTSLQQRIMLEAMEEAAREVEMDAPSAPSSAPVTPPSAPPVPPHNPQS